MPDQEKSPPLYNAYKPVKVTDGLMPRLVHEFDHSVMMTEDDAKAFELVTFALAPQARMQDMEARLDSLENPSPDIQMHVERIRAIHAVLRQGKGGGESLNLKELETLAETELLWKNIVVLSCWVPLAKESKNNKELAKKFKEIAANKEGKLRSRQGRKPT